MVWYMCLDVCVCLFVHVSSWLHEYVSLCGRVWGGTIYGSVRSVYPRLSLWSCDDGSPAHSVLDHCVCLDSTNSDRQELVCYFKNRK